MPSGCITDSVSAVEAVARRTPVRINSFRYFVQKLVALTDPVNRAWRKNQLGKIVRRIQDNDVGRADYSLGDFVEGRATMPGSIIGCAGVRAECLTATPTQISTTLPELVW